MTILDPTDEQLAALARLSSGLCHYNPAFLRANNPGGKLVLFVHQGNGGLIAGAAGYERTGRLWSRLTLPTQPIVSTTAADGGAVLWGTIRAHCRARRIATLSMHSYEGQSLLEPPLGRVESRTVREEFVVDLSPSPERLMPGFSENHRRNLKKALKAGASAERVTAAEGADAHAEMVRGSMQRRVARGETVGLDTDRAHVRRLLQSGAAFLMQVRGQGIVLASLLILTTSSHAYYHSGGARAEGMKIGASHFAIWCAMEELHRRGIQTFCLGGTSGRDSDGLIQFKLGFNPRRIPLAHCRYAMDLAFPWNVLRSFVRR